MRGSPPSPAPSGERASRPSALAAGVSARAGGHILQTVLLDRLRRQRAVHATFIGERLQRPHDEGRPVDLEEPACCGTGVGEAEPVGTERRVRARHPRPDLVLDGVHEVADRDDRALGVRELLRHVRRARLVERVQEVVLVGGQAVSAQLGPARHRPDVGHDTPVLAEQLLRLECPRHPDARGEELHAVPIALADGDAVDAADDALDVDVLRLGRLHERLVVDRDVVHDVRVGVVPAVHALQARPHDVRDLVPVRGVVGDRRRVRGCQQVGVAVGVLQAFARQRRAAGGGADDEPARHLVAGGPLGVTGALEAEHRVEDVDRDERLAVRRVRGARRGERRDGARLVDADVQDLALRALLVRQEQLTVHRRVVLPVRVVDLGRREVRVHAERARLVGNDRDDAVAEVLRPQQVLQQTHERHRRGDLLRAGALLRQRVRTVVGEVDRHVVRAALGQEPAEAATTLDHVLDRLVLVARVVVRRGVRVLLELRVRDRDAHRVAEVLEVLEGHLLHLVGRVAALEVVTETVALDRLGEDDGGLTLVLDGGVVRRVQLLIVQATAAELAPDVLVRPVLDHVGGALVATEEVVADELAVLGAVGLEVAVRRRVHEVHERAGAVDVEQLVPAATPDDLDDVPARAAEEALQLLDDLAVAADRAVEALEVAVDDERQVVQALVRGNLQLAAAFDLVHLAVAEERPNVRVGEVLDAAVRQVLVVHRLVDGVDRTETHRDSRELPVIRHQTRVRVGRDADGRLGLLLAEAVELVGGEPTLEEGPGVDAGGGVTLDEDLVAAAGVVQTPEEVVEAHFVQRGRGRVGGDVPADADAGALRAVHREGGVPADPPAVAALQLLITGELGLVLGRDRVDVVRRRDLRHVELQLVRGLQEAQHDLAAAPGALGIHELLEGLPPLRRLVGIAVQRALRVRILIVDSHGRPFVVWQVMPGMGLRTRAALYSTDNASPLSLATLRRGGVPRRGLLHWGEGPLAQLVERHVYTVDVVGSIPAGPTVTFTR
ncbi:Arginase/agmatinase/formimionoglutamate hydrolase, arginase family [uncultured Microbacterium sp.]|uniref:Arginase/agmatinase/formimionoglutamate hydrolase, arginase family n=1 Tax=uncultured Microbacterium sp. TaxID=191216 RepID=A0A1Y5P4T3_9MICO|nr:Arginase/agmatinase/formimionoglutamate hydrolase, arginase family [uncultured Microbacterium sp.]